MGAEILLADASSGRPAAPAGRPFVGIIYVRPGHIAATFTLAILDALNGLGVDVSPPFVVVAERRDKAVRVRARTTPPW